MVDKLQLSSGFVLGFCCCRARALGPWAPQLWLTGLAAPVGMGSSLTGIKPVSAALAGISREARTSGNLNLGPSLIYHWSLGAAEKPERAETRAAEGRSRWPERPERGL